MAEPRPDDISQVAHPALTRRGLLGALLGAAAGVARRPTAAGDDRPNIVLLLADDLDGRLLLRMPKVRSLLRERGTVFPNFILTNPMCSPSRASILRGQYAHNHAVQSNIPPHGGYERFVQEGHERSTVATWLQDAGYRTGLIGKYFNGYVGGADQTYVPPGWDRWFGLSHLPYYGWKAVDDGTPREPADPADPARYVTDVLAAEAEAFVLDQPDRPFFLFVAATAPHNPRQDPPRYLDQVPKARAPRTPSFNEQDRSDKPSWVREKASLTAKEIAAIDETYRWRLRTSLVLDDLVERVVDGLAAADKLDNTFVLFTSDNGYLLGEHGLVGKGMPYDESLRVPLVVRGPGVPPGASDERIVLNTDLAPTFAEWAGAEVPDFVDGRSFAALLRSEEPPWRRLALVTHGAENGTPDRQGIWSLGWTYAENRGAADRELYDRRADPYQLDNLARAKPAKTERWANRLRTIEGCAGDECRVAEMGATPTRSSRSVERGDDGRRRASAPGRPGRPGAKRGEAGAGRAQGRPRDQASDSSMKDRPD